MAHDMRDQDRLKSAVIERVADLAAEKHLGLAMILAGFDILRRHIVTCRTIQRCSP